MLSAWMTLMQSLCGSVDGGQSPQAPFVRPQASLRDLEPAASGLLRNQEFRPVPGMITL